MNTTTAAWRYVLNHLESATEAATRRTEADDSAEDAVPGGSFASSVARRARPRGRRATPIDARCRGDDASAPVLERAARATGARPRGPGRAARAVGDAGDREDARRSTTRAPGVEAPSAGPRNAAGDAITVPATPRRGGEPDVRRADRSADAWTKHVHVSASHLRCDAWLGIRKA
jgi:hypothetical protein